MTELSLFDLYALFCVNGIGNRKLNRILQSYNSGFVDINSLVTKEPDAIKEALPVLGKKDTGERKPKTAIE